MATVIITGGTGLIGKALAANLSNDYDVVVLSRNPKKHASSMPGIKIVQWDAVSADGWGEHADGAHAIINLAGAGIADARWSPPRKEMIINSRVNAGKAVVEAIKQATNKPQILLQASAVGFYGDREAEVLDETSAVGSGFLAEVVDQWETSTAAVEAMGVRRAVMRIGIVLSNDGGALPKLVMPFTMFAGGGLGSGEQWMSWIHEFDLVRSIRALMENSASNGVYNMTAPSPIENITMARKIGTVMGKPSLLSVPAISLKLLMGEMSAVVLEGQRVLPKRLLGQGYRFLYSDAETALRNLLVA
ncbi:MAG: TIGR01777 family oxidoreductase [Candidatus Promineifilaceae bacterium]